MTELTWLPGSRSFRRGPRERVEAGGVSVLDRSGKPAGAAGDGRRQRAGQLLRAAYACAWTRAGDMYVGEVSHTLSLGGKAFPLPEGHHSLQKLARRA